MRGDAIEERVRTAFSGHFAGRVLGEVKVACTITLCELSGTANGDPEAARAAFRAPAVQQAFAAIGYSGARKSSPVTTDRRTSSSTSTARPDAASASAPIKSGRSSGVR